MDNKYNNKEGDVPFYARIGRFNWGVFILSFSFAIAGMGLYIPFFTIAFLIAISLVFLYYRDLSAPFFKYLLDDSQNKANSSKDDSSCKK